MALERIDPFDREDRYCVDHILRYAWAVSFVREKRVLDIACGTGFGTTLLAHGGAAQVTGVDRSEEAVARCCEAWAVTNAEFRAGTVEDIGASGMEPFDVAVTFETLEHVAEPAAALRSLKAALAPGGILIGSVPGETESEDDNEFHLHHFSRAALEGSLRGLFREVRIFRQRFRLGSVVDAEEEDEGAPMTARDVRVVQLDFGHADSAADTYLFVASDGTLPPVGGDAAAWSRAAWRDFSESAANAFRRLDEAHRQLSGLHAKYRRLFAEKGDLQRRFTNVLGWGKFHYEQLHGKEPERHHLKSIEDAQSRREEQLRQRVEELRAGLVRAEAENEELREKLRRAAETRRDSARERKQSFEKGLESAGEFGT